MITDEKLVELREQAKRAIDDERKNPWKISIAMEPITLWVIVSDLLRVRKTLEDITGVIHSHQTPGVSARDRIQ